MKQEQADNITYDLVALVSNKASYYYLKDFPIDYKKELNIDQSEKNVSDAIIYLIKAGMAYKDQGEDSSDYGRVSAMIQYNIVTEYRIKEALKYNYERTSSKEITYIEKSLIKNKNYIVEKASKWLI